MLQRKLLGIAGLLLIALDGRLGAALLERKWRTGLPGHSNGESFIGTVCADGSVVVAGSTGRLIVLDRTGQILLQVPHPAASALSCWENRYLHISSGDTLSLLELGQKPRALFSYRLNYPAMSTVSVGMDSVFLSGKDNTTGFPLHIDRDGRNLGAYGFEHPFGLADWRPGFSQGSAAGDMETLGAAFVNSDSILVQVRIGRRSQSRDYCVEFDRKLERLGEYFSCEEGNLIGSNRDRQIYFLDHGTVTSFTFNEPPKKKSPPATNIPRDRSPIEIALR